MYNKEKCIRGQGITFKGDLEMASSCLCPKFEKAFQLLGKRWTGVIIHVLSEGHTRFNEIGEQIPNISQKMLADRLKDLEQQGIVERVVFPETPVRIEYHLTEKGEELYPVMAELQKWAEKWV